MPRSTPPTSMPEGPGLDVPLAISGLPLAGLTLLTVEDSRFASEALRLLCQCSGARLRRAETMAAARHHLQIYRPDVVIIDLGLPDGPGTELIAELASGSFDGLIMASSGDPDTRSAALAAGAIGFLEKPLDSLSAFQNAILAAMHGKPATRPADPGHQISPDPQALQDDLIHACDLIAASDADQRRYGADFVRSLARSSHDTRLEGAARAARNDTAAMAGLALAITRRIDRAPDPFRQAACTHSTK